MKEPGNESSQVRSNSNQQLRLLEFRSVLSTGFSVLLKILGQFGIGAPEIVKKRAVERFDAPHAIQVGILEPGNPELKIPRPGFLTRIFRQVF